MSISAAGDQHEQQEAERLERLLVDRAGDRRAPAVASDWLPSFAIRSKQRRVGRDRERRRRQAAPGEGRRQHAEGSRSKRSSAWMTTTRGTAQMIRSVIANSEDGGAAEMRAAMMPPAAEGADREQEGRTARTRASAAAGSCLARSSSAPRLGAAGSWRLPPDLDRADHGDHVVVDHVECRERALADHDGERRPWSRRRRSSPARSEPANALAMPTRPLVVVIVWDPRRSGRRPARRSRLPAGRRRPASSRRTSALRIVTNAPARVNCARSAPSRPAAVRRSRSRWA